jgi:hypothetical protein
MERSLRDSGERKDGFMNQRATRVLVSLLTGFGVLVAVQSPVAQAEPPLTQAPACIKRG